MLFSFSIDLPMLWPNGQDQFMTPSCLNIHHSRPKLKLGTCTTIFLFKKLCYLKIFVLKMQITDFILLNRTDGWLLGDSAYGLKKYMMTPKLNPSTPAEENYNETHSKTRVVVERALGVCKSRFR